MKPPLTPKDEEFRLRSLRDLALLDTQPDPALDALVALTRQLYDIETCLVSLVDAHRQWFKAKIGLEACETPRDVSFCGHAILNEDVFTVRDTLLDDRFADNPLVTGPPYIRFYSGAPLQLANGQRIGTLCVISPEPRMGFDDRDERRLADLARLCVQIIAGRSDMHLAGRLLDQLPIGIMLSDLRGDVLDVNPAFAGMINRSRDAIKGMALRSLTPESFLASDLREFEAAQANGRCGPYQKEFLRPDGVAVPVQVRGLLVERDGSEVLLSVIEDITQRRKTEFELIQAQKMEAIGQLTGGLAHDFNNMLGVIIGNLDLLERDLAGQPGARARMETARTAALRGADLTRALLSVARKQALASEPVDLNARLSELLPLVQHTVGGGIDVVVDLEAEPMVDVDSSGLASTILNLVINARDAMPDGGRLSLKTRLRWVGHDDADDVLPPGHYVALSVSDTGAGMSPEILARAADPFFTTKMQGRGTGLGLAMAQGFAKQSRGDFRIYSEMGHGTSVTFLLPVAAQAAPAAPVGIDAPRGVERLLVVDDELELLAVSATWLKDLGYEVTPCATPRSAIVALGEAAAARRPYDMLVTDVIMPGMNGFSLAQACRKAQPELAVLFVSGFADVSDREDQHVEGELLQKPFRQSELAMAARRALAAHKASPPAARP